MTSRFAMPDTPNSPTDDLSAEDVTALLPLLEQLHQARSDQREALIWLAEHEGGTA